MKTEELRNEARIRIEGICMELLPAGKRIGQEWQVGDVSGAQGKSLRVCLDGENAGLWKDHADSEKKGDVFDLWMRVRNVDFTTAKWQISDWCGMTWSGYRINGKRPKSPQQNVKLPADFRRGSLADFKALAKLRGWQSTSGLKAASDAGCLGFATFRDKISKGDGWEVVSAWLVLDPTRRNVSARRMDGKPWECLADRPKTRSLKGSYCENRPAALYTRVLASKQRVDS